MVTVANLSSPFVGPDPYVIAVLLVESNDPGIGVAVRTHRSELSHSEPQGCVEIDRAHLPVSSTTSKHWPPIVLETGECVGRYDVGHDGLHRNQIVEASPEVNERDGTSRIDGPARGERRRRADRQDKGIDTDTQTKCERVNSEQREGSVHGGGKAEPVRREGTSQNEEESLCGFGQTVSPFLNLNAIDPSGRYIVVLVAGL
jgi:hypothetical protein